MQKLSSINQFILEKHILEPNDLKDHAHPEIIKVTSSFPEFVSWCKKYFIPSIYSWDTTNFRILWQWPLTILTMPSKHFWINFELVTFNINLY